MKVLGNRARRKEIKVNQLKDLLTDLQKQHLLETDPATIMERCFDGSVVELVKNELTNAGRSSYGRRYSQEVKQFALTLHYYSPHYVPTIMV